ncbi:MAG TPA: nucleoside recognition domain-containing protein [Clostridia bacterium]|jgi:spore maturation protein SpmB|nr:nucleoside recognition domain-containing protein [Clostridia bacterium]HRU41143.1 nucleoside recognition domain-containing protein [Candidatus Diapherotrites archaeon]
MDIKQTVMRGSKGAFKVILDLIKYIIPAVFILKALEHSGWLVRIADFFEPYMSYIGLPGEGALVIMMGQVTLYSAIAAMAVIDITVKQMTIVSTFVAIFHSCILESAVISKAGGNGVMVIGLRFVAAILACFILNILIPGV